MDPKNQKAAPLPAKQFAFDVKTLKVPEGFPVRRYLQVNQRQIEAARDVAKTVAYNGQPSVLPFVGNIDWGNYSSDQFPLTTVNGSASEPMILETGPDDQLQLVSGSFVKRASTNNAKETEYVMALPAGDMISRLLSNPIANVTEEVVFNEHYVCRSWCEKSTEWLQHLPYIVFFKRFGDRYEIFVYQRGKGVGEERLASNYSIGVGGHVNPHDQFEYLTDEALTGLPGPYERDHGVVGALLRNIKREVDEEVTIFRNGESISLSDLPGYDDTAFANSIFSKLAAFLDYGSGQDVEKVHLGLFIGIEVPEDVEIYTKEEELIDVGFIELEELYIRRDDLHHADYKEAKPLENWSKAIVESAWITKDFHPTDNVDWRTGTLARIFGEQYDLYQSNLFMKL